MGAINFERRLCFVWRISAVGRGSSERGAGDPLGSERPLARQDRGASACGRLLRGQHLALTQVVQAAVDPQLVELFLDAVLRQAAMQRLEIDAVHLLVLIVAGEDDCLGAGLGSRCNCRHSAQISFIMHCIGELIEAIAR